MCNKFVAIKSFYIRWNVSWEKFFFLNFFCSMRKNDLKMLHYLTNNDVTIKYNLNIFFSFHWNWSCTRGCYFLLLLLLSDFRSLIVCCKRYDLLFILNSTVMTVINRTITSRITFGFKYIFYNKSYSEWHWKNSRGLFDIPVVS